MRTVVTSRGLNWLCVAALVAAGSVCMPRTRGAR